MAPKIFIGESISNYYFLRFFKNANKLAPAAAAVADPANNPVPTNTPVFVPSVFLESSFFVSVP